MERRQFMQSVGLAPLALQPNMFASLDASTARDDGPEAAMARRVLTTALEFGSGGGYDKSWGGSGAPTDIVHGGATILSRATSGTYCCGFTFAVAMGALAGSPALASKSALDVRAFQKAWYGATKETSERQCATAVTALGVGREVPLAEARAGDFAQLWRMTKMPSGHSVLFLSWIEIRAQRVGFNYLSSQGSTNGIGFSAEFFSDAELGRGRVDRSRLYFARLTPIPSSER